MLSAGRKTLAALAISIFAPIVAAGQGTTLLRGKVVDESGAPIRGATVTLTQLGFSVRTDSAGVFALSGTAGSTLSFIMRAIGYRSDTAAVTLPRRSGVSRDFTLVSEATALPEANPSDRIVRGYVTDAEGIGLSYATVQINGGRRIVADDSGQFIMPAPATRFWLLVRRIGFSPAEVTLDASPDTAIRIRMTPVATALPEQRITGRAAFTSLDLNGFYSRMKDAERGINHGYFVTPEDFEFRNPHLITQMAESYPAVYVLHKPGNGRGDQILGAPCRPRGRDDKACVPNGKGGYQCAMTVYLDRVRITGKLGNMPDDLVNELVLPTHVAAMEIYPRGVGAPPQYQSMNGSCGVVLIWSK